MRKRLLKNPFVVARTLDDDGWCIYIRDSGGGLHKLHDENFFYSEEVTHAMRFRVFPSAERAQTFFKTMLYHYRQRPNNVPIIRDKRHIEEYWLNKQLAWHD